MECEKTGDGRMHSDRKAEMPRLMNFSLFLKVKKKSGGRFK